MINKTNNCYSLTKNEIYRLGVLLQIPGFIAIEDPFIGYLIQELQEEMKITHQSLIDQGYLKINEEGFVIDSDLKKAAETIATSPKVVIAAKEQSSILIHISEDCIVNQETTSNGHISLSTLLDWGEAKKHLREFFSLSGSSTAPGPVFSAGAAVIEQARAIFKTEGHENAFAVCKQLLLENAIPTDAAEALTKTLSGKYSTGSLVVFDRENLTLHPQGGFAWLTGDQGTWKIGLPPSEVLEIMEWTPISSALLIDQIENFISEI